MLCLGVKQPPAHAAQEIPGLFHQTATRATKQAGQGASHAAAAASSSTRALLLVLPARRLDPHAHLHAHLAFRCATRRRHARMLLLLLMLMLMLILILMLMVTMVLRVCWLNLSSTEAVASATAPVLRSNALSRITPNTKNKLGHMYIFACARE